eukprot:6008550-Prymnesium_polylepis.1
MTRESTHTCSRLPPQVVMVHLTRIHTGTWLAAQVCTVFREACPDDWYRAQCEAILPACGNIADGNNASVDGVACPKASVVQPCRW